MISGRQLSGQRRQVLPRAQQRFRALCGFRKLSGARLLLCWPLCRITQHFHVQLGAGGGDADFIEAGVAHVSSRMRLQEVVRVTLQFEHRAVDLLLDRILGNQIFPCRSWLMPSRNEMESRPPALGHHVLEMTDG